MRKAEVGDCGSTKDIAGIWTTSTAAHAAGIVGGRWCRDRACRPSIPLGLSAAAVATNSK